MSDGGAPYRFVGRRQFLQGAGALGLLAVVPPVRFGRLMAAAPGPGAAQLADPNQFHALQLIDVGAHEDRQLSGGASNRRGRSRLLL